MKKLFESWRKFTKESKVVDLNRHAFNTSADELYGWFEWIAHQDTSIDEEAPNYDELVKESGVDDLVTVLEKDAFPRAVKEGTRTHSRR